ncbi:protein of unknown function [Magnetospirillum sp. XM-1]|uniref:sugar phosphate isomerase/epimerase family protein n=1 Tax=Magnetospirillum sp. XM-1 TaxID=1663591 RepID=UPI00073DD795|nr:TIM barrel protein [Magnetospirillum sp. XM-1]CUW37968.1 protein of unknown function [Magnetospirillum sp. XM-1]
MAVGQLQVSSSVEDPPVPQQVPVVHDHPYHPPANLIHRGLGRFEILDLNPAMVEHIPSLCATMAEEGRTGLSVHLPVFRPHWAPQCHTHWYFLHADGERREHSFRLLEHGLAWASRLNADYAVCHLTFGETDTTDPIEARRLAHAACKRIAAAARSHGVMVDVEFAAYSDGFHSAEGFMEALADLPELGICLDVGHLWIGAARRCRDPLKDAAILASRIRSMHLWHGRSGLRERRPLHPDNQAKDGWFDIPALLDTVLGQAPYPAIIFEYPVDRVTSDIQQGYDWIAGLLGAPWQRSRP